MAVFLKKVKKELEKGKSKVSSHTPPNYVWRDTSKYPVLGVSKFEQRIRSGLNLAEYVGVVKSENVWKDTDPNYKVSIRFTDLTFLTKEPKSKIVADKMKTLIIAGKKVWFYPPTFDNNPVQMKCQCTDFRHRFETQLAQFGGIIGSARKYKRLTPPWPVGRPYANHADSTGSAKISIRTGGDGAVVRMNSKLGYCKHIHSLLHYLKAEGYVTETRREL